MTEFYIKPDEKLLKRRFIEYRSLYIDPLIPKDKSIKILDIGCGYGLFLDALNRCGYKNIEGVEIGENYVNYAQNELRLRNVVKEDLFSYLEKQPDGKYDVISAFNIIEHIKKEKVIEVLGLISRKLKNDGIFLCEVPNADSPLGIHTMYMDITHEFAYTKGLMVHLLKMVDFKEIIVKPNRVRSNLLIRLAQKVLAKIVGFDDKLMFSGNIIVIGYKGELTK